MNKWTIVSRVSDYGEHRSIALGSMPGDGVFVLSLRVVEKDLSDWPGDPLISFNIDQAEAIVKALSNYGGNHYPNG